MMSTDDAVVAVPPPSCPDVSISLVTRDRPLFLEHALELIALQDYPLDRIEVVLVDSSNPPIKSLLEHYPVFQHLRDAIRYFHVDRPTSIGEKRNLAVKQSRGSIVVQWDDDDYYGPNRLRVQVKPILEGRAKCSALSFRHWYFLDQDEFWCGPPAELGYGLNGGHPGTFAFDRTIWSETDKRLQYPNTSFADPDDFQSAAADLLNARTEEIGSEVDFIYVRHRYAAASCEGDLCLGMEECILGIYFEVLGVRGFGRRLPKPDFVPQSTHELWARIRKLQSTSVTVAPTQSCDDQGGYFDRHAADALKLLSKNMSRYSDAELASWARGETSIDGTQKRAEIRRIFLADILPALLTRLANAPAYFPAGVLACAVSVCNRVGYDCGCLLAVVAQSLRPRLHELTREEEALIASSITDLGCLGNEKERLVFPCTWEIVD